MILCIEIFIALYIRDHFIRPYIGDVLVVMLVYCVIKSILNIRSVSAAFISFVFACLVETGQYFHLVEVLSLQHNKFATIVIGNSFSWEDIIAYFIGALIIFLLDRSKAEKKIDHF